MFRRAQIPVDNNVRGLVSLKYDVPTGVLHVAYDVVRARDAAAFQHLGIRAHEPEPMTNRSYFHPLRLHRLAQKHDRGRLVRLALSRMLLVTQPVHRVRADADNAFVGRRVGVLDLRLHRDVLLDDARVGIPAKAQLRVPPQMRHVIDCIPVLGEILVELAVLRWIEMILDEDADLSFFHYDYLFRIY
jgi:hypothetical protein